MCGLDCTMNVILDTHGRVIDCIFGSHPEAHREAIRALQRDLHVRVVRTRARPGGHRHLRRLRADRPPLLPHGLGLHVGGPRAQGRRHDHLHEPVTGRLDRDRRLPGSRADGPDEAVHAADARELRARAARHPLARDPDVGGVHLGADLRGDDAQAPDARHAARRTWSWRPTSASTRRRRSTRRSRRRWSGTERTRRSRCCRTRATSCRGTRCACTPRTRISSSWPRTAERWTSPGARSEG